jgi:hypothetical protein
MVNATFVALCYQLNLDFMKASLSIYFKLWNVGYVFIISMIMCEHHEAK